MEARQGNYRKAILELESPVPLGAWEKISIPEEKISNKWSWRVAASILLILGLGIKVNLDQTTSIKNPIAKKKVETNSTEVLPIEESPKAELEHPQATEEPQKNTLWVASETTEEFAKEETQTETSLPVSEPKMESKKGRKVKITLAFAEKEILPEKVEENETLEGKFAGLKRFERKVKRQYNLKKAKMQTLFAANQDSVSQKKDVN